MTDNNTRLLNASERKKTRVIFYLFLALLTALMLILGGILFEKEHELDKVMVSSKKIEQTSLQNLSILNTVRKANMGLHDQFLSLFPAKKIAEKELRTLTGYETEANYALKNYKLLTSDPVEHLLTDSLKQAWAANTIFIDQILSHNGFTSDQAGYQDEIFNVIKRINMQLTELSLQTSIGKINQINENYTDIQTRDKLFLRLLLISSAVLLLIFVFYIYRESRNNLLLERSEQTFYSLFNQSPVPKWLFDPYNYRILRVNEAALEQYGYSRDEFLSMTIMDLRAPEDYPEVEKIITRIRASGEFFKGIFTHKNRRGDKLQVEIHSRDFTFSNKKVRLVVALNITQQLEHVRLIEEQNEKLKEIAWMQSHVVRAPLARIIGLVELMRIGAEPDMARVRAYLTESADELDHVIQEIINKAEQLEIELKIIPPDN